MVCGCGRAPGWPGAHPSLRGRCEDCGHQSPAPAWVPAGDVDRLRSDNDGDVADDGDRAGDRQEVLLGKQVRDLAAPTYAAGSVNEHATVLEEGSNGSIVMKHERVLQEDLELFR